MPKIQCPNCATAILAADAPTMRRYAAKIRAADGKVAICSNHRVMGDDSDPSDPNAFYAGPGDPGTTGGAAPSTPAPAPSGGGVNFGSVVGDIGQAAGALGQVAQAGVGIYNAVTGKNQPAPVRPPVAPPKPPVVVLSFTQRHRDLVYGSGGILVAILLVAVIWKFAGKHEKKHEK